jgi:hypothetical protein
MSLFVGSPTGDVLCNIQLLIAGGLELVQLASATADRVSCTPGGFAANQERFQTELTAPILHLRCRICW